MNKCDPAAALSDGTPNYLGAAALKLAYESWDSRGGMQVGRKAADVVYSCVNQRMGHTSWQWLL